MISVKLPEIPVTFWELIRAWSNAPPSPMGRQDIGWEIDRVVKAYAEAAIEASWSSSTGAITINGDQVLVADDAGDDHLAGAFEVQPDEAGSEDTHWYFVPSGHRLTAKQTMLIAGEVSRRNGYGAR